MLSRKLTGTLAAGIFALGVAAAAAPAQAATFGVVNTNDAGAGSLRSAILAANMTAAQDQIQFQIPGAGVHVISLANDLPFVTQPVAIRGYSQPGSSVATAVSAANPTVVIDATNAARGLHITGNGVQVRGLVINDAQVDGIWVTGNDAVVAGNYIGTNAAGNATVPNGQYGVHIDGADNRIGGPAPADRNLVSGNFSGNVRVHTGTGNVVEGNYLGPDETGTAGLGGNIGVLVESSQTTVKDNLSSFNVTGVQVEGDDNTVQGNSIGTDVSGDADLGNIIGVTVFGGDGNLIGGAAEGEGNLVSGNLFSGVQLVSPGAGDPAEDNDVQGNVIGLSASGTPLPNGTGVSINASSNNRIGGVDGTGNVISGNETDGVRILSDGADDNEVQGNWIGTDDSGALLGNGESGVEIDGGAQNRIGATAAQNPANVIAHNGDDGVTVVSGVGNAIVRNSIHDNGLLGIDLDANGTTANDGSGDPDSGPNTLQNGPEIDQVIAGEVEWELESEPNATYRLEFFANDACDGSGSGEAQTHLDTIQVTTDANGDADDTTATAIPPGLGQHVSMTATRLVGAGLVARSTSELAPCEEAL